MSKKEKKSKGDKMELDPSLTERETVRRSIIYNATSCLEIQDEEELKDKLVRYGLVSADDNILRRFHPLYHLSKALRLAAKYGVTFNEGVLWGGVRAYLPRELWKGERPTNHFRLMRDEPRDVMWVEAKTVQEAVVRLLIESREIGLI